MSCCVFAGKDPNESDKMIDALPTLRDRLKRSDPNTLYSAVNDLAKVSDSSKFMHTHAMPHMMPTSNRFAGVFKEDTKRSADVIRRVFGAHAQRSTRFRLEWRLRRFEWNSKVSRSRISCGMTSRLKYRHTRIFSTVFVLRRKSLYATCSTSHSAFRFHKLAMESSAVFEHLPATT